MTEAIKHKFVNWQQTIVYVCLLGILVFILVMDARDNARDDKARCLTGVDVRNVQRATVEAIYTLATGSIQRDADSPPLTKEELRQYNAYIDRVNGFRSDMYAQIKPSKLCAPFVEDDLVKPSTPPQPPIKR